MAGDKEAIKQFLAKPFEQIVKDAVPHAQQALDQGVSLEMVLYIWMHTAVRWKEGQKPPR